VEGRRISRLVAPVGAASAFAIHLARGQVGQAGGPVLDAEVSMRVRRGGVKLKLKLPGAGGGAGAGAGVGAGVGALRWHNDQCFQGREQRAAKALSDPVARSPAWCGAPGVVPSESFPPY